MTRLWALGPACCLSMPPTVPAWAVGAMVMLLLALVGCCAFCIVKKCISKKKKAKKARERKTGQRRRKGAEGEGDEAKVRAELDL